MSAYAKDMEESETCFSRLGSVFDMEVTGSIPGCGQTV